MLVRLQEVEEQHELLELLEPLGLELQLLVPFGWLPVVRHEWLRQDHFHGRILLRQDRQP
jgi:hypothetical protein